MQPTTYPPAAPPLATWADILERVEQALQHTMAEVAGRSQEPEPPPAGGMDQDAAWRQRLEQCDARLRQLQACVRQAESHAAEADSALAASAEALQGWLASAAAARQKLENREGHPV